MTTLSISRLARRVLWGTAAAFCLSAPAIAQTAPGALNCAITPSRVIEIASPISGVLAEVLVRPGQIVEAGELIARIDTDIASAELAAAEARVQATGDIDVAEARRASAASQFSSAKSAYNQQLMSKMEYSRIRGDLAVAQREVTSAEEKVTLAAADAAHLALMVEKGEVRAPAGGVIGEELLDPSESVDGRPIAQLIVTDPLRVEVFATPDAVEAIEAGEEYVVLAGARAPQRLTPELDYISPLADQSSRTIKVYYHLRGEDVRPGTRCLLAPAGAETN